MDSDYNLTTYPEISPIKEKRVNSIKSYYVYTLE